jgi:hypothetical protein
MEPTDLCREFVKKILKRLAAAQKVAMLYFDSGPNSFSS